MVSPGGSFQMSQGINMLEHLKTGATDEVIAAAFRGSGEQGELTTVPGALDPISQHSCHAPTLPSFPTLCTVSSE